MFGFLRSTTAGNSNASDYPSKMHYLKGFRVFAGLIYSRHNVCGSFQFSKFNKAIVGWNNNRLKLYSSGLDYKYSVKELSTRYTRYNFDAGVMAGYFVYSLDMDREGFDNMSGFIAPGLRIKVTSSEFISFFVEYNIMQPLPWERENNDNVNVFDKVVLHNYGFINAGGNLNF